MNNRNSKHVLKENEDNILNFKPSSFGGGKKRVMRNEEGRKEWIVRDSVRQSFVGAD